MTLTIVVPAADCVAMTGRMAELAPLGRLHIENGADNLEKSRAPSCQNASACELVRANRPVEKTIG